MTICISVLIQVYFQICNSSALGSKRICKKIRKEKLFCFQLISLHISEQKKNKAIQKGVSSQPAISHAIILINIEKKIIHSLFSSENNHWKSFSLVLCTGILYPYFQLWLRSYHIGLGSCFVPLLSFPDTAFGIEVSGRFLSVTFLKYVEERNRGHPACGCSAVFHLSVTFGSL